MSIFTLWWGFKKIKYKLLYIYIYKEKAPLISKIDIIYLNALIGLVIGLTNHLTTNIHEVDKGGLYIGFKAFFLIFK